MKNQPLGTVATGFLSIITGLLALFVLTELILPLCMRDSRKSGSSWRTNHGFQPSSYESLKEDPEKLNAYALNHWEKVFENNGDLVCRSYDPNSKKCLEVRPFGKSDQTNNVTTLRRVNLRYSSMLRVNAARDVQDLEGMVMTPPVIAVKNDRQPIAQWAYHADTQTFTGRTLPVKKSKLIGYLGRNGLTEDPSAAEPLGTFVSAKLLQREISPTSNILIWNTLDYFSIVDLNRKEILFQKTRDNQAPMNRFAIDDSSSGIIVFITQFRSGEWVAGKLTDGNAVFYQGLNEHDAVEFLFDGTTLFIREDGSEVVDAMRLPPSERKTIFDELYLRPYKEWTTLYRVKQDSSLEQVRRYEWERDPLPGPVVFSEGKPRFFKTCIQGMQPLLYALHNTSLKTLRMNIISADVPRSRWTDFRLQRLSCAYTHWQLFWTGIALGGLHLYQRKRKLHRAAWAGWGLLVLAFGLSGLLGCWIATRRTSKGLLPAAVDDVQKLLIKE